MSKKKKTGFVGTIVRAKTPKMATVVIERRRRHPLYQKIIRVRTRVHAHDELGAKEGQRVRIVENRPLSRLKRFRVVEVMRDLKGDEQKS